MVKTNANAPTKLFNLLSGTAPNKVFLSIILGSISGLTYALIVPLILMSLEPSVGRLMRPDFDTSYWLFGQFEISNPNQAAAFFLIITMILVLRVASETLIARASVDATVNLRKKLYKRILQLPTQSLEKIGPSRLMTVLNQDIARIVEGAGVIPAILVSASTLLGMLTFLIYLKLEVFLFIVGTIIFGALTYKLPIQFGQRYMFEARNSFDGIQEGMRGLIYGSKELKLHQQKQNEYVDEQINTFEEQYRDKVKTGRMFISLGLNYGTMISFLAIGFVTYIMANYLSLTRGNLLGVIMVLLYITGPIAAMINLLNTIFMARIGVKKLDALLNEMPIEVSSDSTNKIDCREIRVKGLEYTYPAVGGDDSHFHLGPIDLTIKRGEVTYLVGGNGSGKTTLSKLLSLHYIPQNGAIYFDDTKISDDNRDACRQSVSAIYSDFYLFTKLFGVESDKLDEKATKVLKQLGLDEKVTIKNGEFSTTDLSAGQKKRLALLVSFLEDRTVYVFDEWAADQDPEFKDIFYNSILPELKNRDKMVIVITHDDRYFNRADTLVRMETGKVLEVKHTPSEKSPSGARD